MKHDWTTQKLSNLFEFKYGKGLIAEHRNVDGSVKVYGSNGIIGRHNQALSKGPTLVVGRKGSVGEVHFSSIACWPIDTTYFVDEFPDGFSPRYWAFYLKSLRLGTHDKSSAIPGVSRKDMYDIEVPVPPPAEQRRIAAKLEKLLAKVDACRERLDKIPPLLKRFRQSVLAAVCSGRLTHDFTCAAEMEPWREITLSDITAEIRTGPFGSTLHKSDYINGGVPVINPLNIVNGRIQPSSNVTVTESTRNRLRKYLLLEGDIVIARRGEMGRCAVVTSKEAGWLCGTGSDIVRLKSAAFPRYMQIVISSPEAREHLSDTSIGTTMDNLNQRHLSELPLLLPSLPEQHEIVRRVEALFKIADRIEERYQKAKAHVDKLAQSILAKAFRGELVPQSPNSEIASALLASIRQERKNR